MEKLPLEILVLLFSNLNEIFDVLSVRVVCKAFCTTITNSCILLRTERLSPRVLVLFPHLTTASILWKGDKSEKFPIRRYQSLTVVLREQWDEIQPEDLLRIPYEEKISWGLPIDIRYLTSLVVGMFLAAPVFGTPQGLEVTRHLQSLLVRLSQRYRPPSKPGWCLDPSVRKLLEELVDLLGPTDSIRVQNLSKIPGKQEICLRPGSKIP